MPTRETPVTYFGTTINSTIAGISTGYANVFGTSNLTVATSLVMSNATPAIHEAAFYSTTITVTRGDMSLSNTVYNDGFVTTAPDGAFNLSNTLITSYNAGISVINQPYDPNVDGNGYSSNLNNFFLNTNLIVANADSAGVPSAGLQYGGIGFGCNSPSYPIDMTISPVYSTVYHGAAISLNDAGIRINSDQLGQISVTTPGTVAEASFNTTAVGGPLMAYGSGSAARGGYIFATTGDAINIAGTGQVSICNAGIAQTAYSLYVGGNTAINGSTTIINGQFYLSNSTANYARMQSTIVSLSTGQVDLSNTTINMQNGSFTLSNSASGSAFELYSTPLRVINGQFLHSNTAANTAQFFSTSVSIYTGDFLISSTSANQRSATFNGTNLVVNSGTTTLRSTLTMSNSAGTIAANLYSTNLSVYNGNFLHSNTGSVTATANFFSTNVGIFGGNLLMSNSGSATANMTLYSTNMTIYNGSLTLQPPVAKTANFYSTSLNVFGDLSSYSLYVSSTAAFNSSVTMCNGDLTVRNTRTQNADFYSTNMTIRNADFTLSNTGSVTAVATFYSTQVTILNGGFIQSNTTGALATALFYSTAMTVFGPISTTETLYCLGRFNSPNVANISTLILGNNIESTAQVALDVRGTYRTSVQRFSTTAYIQVNGGNLIFASNGSGTVLYLPETNGAEIGVNYTLHSEMTGSLYISSLGGDFINTSGNRLFTITKQTALTSILCLGSGEWNVITNG